MTQSVSLNTVGSLISLATCNLSDDNPCLRVFVTLGPGEPKATTFLKILEAVSVQNLHKPENLRGEAEYSTFHLT